MSKPTKALALLKDEQALSRFEASMEKVLPSHITPNRMSQVALRMIRKNPRLGDCTPESFANSMLECSEMGLEPDGRMAHLVPYGNECTLIPDYKGLVQLAREADGVVDVQPIRIHKHDNYRWINGAAHHEIDPFIDRGEMIGAYTKLVFTNGHTRDSEPMKREEVDKIMKGSQAWRYAEGVVKAKGSGKKDSPWHTNFEAMWLKSVVRRDAKTFPMSNRLKLALDKDDEDFSGAKDITPQVKVSSRLVDVMDAGDDKQQATESKRVTPNKKPPAEKKPVAVPTEKSPAELKAEAAVEDEVKPLDQMSKDEMIEFLKDMYHDKISPDSQGLFHQIGLGHLDDDLWFENLESFSLSMIQKVCADVSAEFE